MPFREMIAVYFKNHIKVTKIHSVGRMQSLLTLKQTVHIQVVTGVLQTVTVILHFTFRSFCVIVLGNDNRLEDISALIQQQFRLLAA
jgi:hypothetical protein